MLVLTRNTDSSLRIGDDIVLKVIEVRGEQVRIGIDAPKDVLVLRQELKRHDVAQKPKENGQ